MGKSISRNDPCPCGSGKKYKHCHYGKNTLESTATRWLLPVVGIAVSAALGIYMALRYDLSIGVGFGVGGVMVVGILLILRNPPPPGGGGDPGAINFGG